MADHPIPDELRGQFLAVLTVPTMRQLHVDLLAAQLDRLVERGAHIELRRPEFAVHDSECCLLHAMDLRKSWYEGPAACPGVGYYHWTVNE